MSQKKAKKLRKQLYGDTKRAKDRKYTKTDTGKIVSDAQRRIYQRMKKAMKGV